MLLVGAGLMIRSFWRLQATDPGFSSQSVVALDVVLPKSKYPSRDIPLTGSEAIWFRIDGRPPVRRGQEPIADRRAVTPGYFRTLGIPLLKGRLSSEADVLGRPPVATPQVVIVNETLARRYFSNEEPIGKQLQLVSGGSPLSSLLSIVGVVRDVKIDSLEDTARAQVYVPMKQSGWASMKILIRADSDPLRIVAAVRSEIRAFDPDPPIANVRTKEKIVSDSVATNCAAAGGTFSGSANCAAGCGTIAELNSGYSR